MTDLAAALLDALDDDALDQLAAKLAPRLSATTAPATSPWLDTKGAAEHISAPVSRIHDLVQLRRLTPCRDGRRLLFRRDDLDRYVEAST